MTKAGKKIIVDAHNALRRKVASGGETPQPAGEHFSVMKQTNQSIIELSLQHERDCLE